VTPYSREPTAERLALVVRGALSTLEIGLSEAAAFDPGQARQQFRIHLSDIGEARFLPPLMHTLHQQAPHIQLETRPLPLNEVADALDRGLLDVAIGFLPGVTHTQRTVLLSDHYGVLLRAGHPALQKISPGQKLSRAALETLDFIAVRSHSETLRILQSLQLDTRIRLSAAHFMAVSSILQQTDLAVLMPTEIASTFTRDGNYVVIDADLPNSSFDVSLHWSWRFSQEPAKMWLRALICQLFQQPQHAANAK
jgi:DNA-binding transcriptional LysR family regulator